MNDQELAEAIKSIRTQIRHVEERCKSRPFQTFDELRKIFSGGNAEEIKTRRRGAQADWDAAHPDDAVLYGTLEGLLTEEQRLRDEQVRREEAEQQRLRSLEVLNDAPRIKARVEAGLRETQATEAIEDWEAAPALWCLLLMGGVGCGKSTSAGAHAFREALKVKNGRWPVWVRAVEASRLSGFGEDATARFDSWRRAPLLVIDDLGTEMLTPTWQQALDDILDHRYQHSLRTVLPTNLKPADFKARYGERIADRIREDGMVRELSAGTMRRKAKSEVA